MKSGIRLLLWMFCLLVLARSASGQIVISEFMADNEATLADENGQFADWIEIYNTSGSTLGSTWTQSGFNDSGWTSGTTGVGYETAVAGFAVHNYVANIGVCDMGTAQGVITTPAQQSAVYSENAAVINYFNTGGSAHYAN